MIQLIRSDERLIHGQCMTQIVKTYDIQEIIVIDDATAENALLKRIFTMAVPKTMKAAVYTLNEGVDKVKEALNNAAKTLILMKTPVPMVELIQRIPELNKDLNIASLSQRKNAGVCVEIVPATYFTRYEFTAVEQLTEAGVQIWLQMIPNSARTEWSEIRERIQQKFNKL